MLRREDTFDATGQIKLHLLDVGPDEYGDSLLCQFGSRSILIDGAHPGDTEARDGHPSIPEQLGKLLDQEEPYHVDLIIVTHAHQDHIGCLTKLIADQRLEADWALAIDPALGWGRAQGEDRDSAFTSDERVLSLAAALREEVRFKVAGDALDRFLADARTLEDRYIEMLDTLNQRGTRVVRFGQQSANQLVQEFQDVGLRIIGPPQEHVLLCADIINQLSRDALQRASDIFRQDAGLDTGSAYLRLISSTSLDALDVSRPGPAINLQSIITRFQYKGHKFLFAGDFQFAKPEVDTPELASSVRRLRRAISQEAPFSFYKVCHHGSHNAFNEEIYQELGGTKILGTCAGSGSTRHPNRKVLAVLRDHDDELTWVRTDRNGLVTITFGQGEPRIKKAKGRLNNFEPNDADVPAEVPSAGAVTAVRTPSTAPVGRPLAAKPAAKPSISTQVSRGEESVEIHARIPHVSTRVTISVDVEPRATGDGRRARGVGAALSGDAPRIAGGRPLDLLFVTSREGLAENIGHEETEMLLDSFEAQKLLLLDDLPRGLVSGQAAEFVREGLRRHPDARGVVLIGGYDVVPAQILDSLPKDLRRALPANEDPDRFYVWNDEVYGDRDGDELPEVPVSRIPDGKSASLVYKALQTAESPRSRRMGIRNVARPFANGIFQELPGDSQLLVSKVTVFNQKPVLDLTADQIYFMLHGDYVDASRFWGEGTPGNLEAVNISNLPTDFSGVVFTGCCWGALTVDTPAGLVVPGRPFGPKAPESSLALSFLARGATAFIGCTGAHYSPTEEPYNYFGGPMHKAFWKNYNGGKPAAQALFDAKIEYIGGIPHGRTGSVQTAIEYKILRQYTCLGLGW